MNNPTRAENYTPPVQKLFITEKQTAEQKQLRNAIKAIEIVCKVFDIPKKLVQEASRHELGEYALTMRGLNAVTFPQFPATISMVQSTEEIKQRISLAQLISFPEKVPIIAAYLKSRKLNPTDKPCILAFTHVFFNSFVCVTCLPLEKCSGLLNLVVNANHYIPDAPDALMPITIGSMSRVMLAIREQGVWQPTVGSYRE